MSEFEVDCSKKPYQQGFHLVGVGASAGGLEALESFFDAMPADSGMAFVVVQHLSPDFKSHMEELLARHTRMAIHRVEDGMQVRPNSIYLIPPRKEMVVAGGKLLLTDKSSDGTFSHPIDLFFRSLANDFGRFSISVVLSGTGSDGSRGIRDIHDAGGLVLAQDEASAKFDGMPMNAQSTGVVDIVQTPEMLAEVLVRYAKEGVSVAELAGDEAMSTTTEGVARVFYLLNQQHGIDFSQYKISTVGRRIQRRIDLLGIGTLERYIERLESDPSELNDLYKDLLIGVTKFFRDREAYAVLEQDVIPALFTQATHSAIRIWIAGCATGEEAYSIAILIDEEARRRKENIDVKIFATDVHHVSLHTAARGIYPEESLNEMSAERRHQYFRKHRDGYHVTRELRARVVFAPHNLINDAPFTQMDLVTCRNLLIYLQPNAQKKVLSLFHFALKAGKTLFLGPSESPGELSDEFQLVDKRWKIYRKRRDTRLPLETRLPLGSLSDTLPRTAIKTSNRMPQRQDTLLLSTYDRLLERKMPPSILVDDSFNVRHVFGGAERYLRPRGGRPSSNVLDIIDETLKTPLVGALQHAANKEDQVRYSGIEYSSKEDRQWLRIVIEPIDLSAEQTRNFLISIEVEGGTKSEGGEDVNVNMSELARDRVAGLESELRYSQENLQATIEEMETSNEELQASNEELVASNEELQSTNEELHSVNEELYTVNAEHQRRVEELGVANNDMDNLLATTRVGVIFLDDELCIRRFTPEIAKLFQLMPHDIGRSIEGFRHNLVREELADDLREVISTQREKEVEVEDRRGNPYLMRALPYRSDDQQIIGVVLTLVDIRSLKIAQRDLKRFKYMTDFAIDPILLIDRDANVVYANVATSRTLLCEHDKLLKMSVMDFDPVYDRTKFDELFNRASDLGAQKFESVWKREDGTFVPVEISMNIVEFDGRKHLCAFIRDISDRRRAGLGNATSTFGDRVGLEWCCDQRRDKKRQSDHVLQSGIHQIDRIQSG